ncbi:hypothetical protein Tco_1281614, partial [Tanacetum coccineum]
MYERPLTTPLQNLPQNITFLFQRYTMMFQQRQDESLYDAWIRYKDLIRKWKNATSTISDQTIANLKDLLVGNEVVRVKIPSCMSWLDAYDEPLGDLDMMDDKVENPDTQSSPQVLPSFVEYAPPVTYLEEVDETLGTPVEVEPLNKPQLEDLGLNTFNHDIPFSAREVPNLDEPPIKPLSSDSFRMKVVDLLTIHTPPSPHLASFYSKDMYFYYHPCIDDPKKHYGFKPGRGLNSLVRPKEVEKVRSKETHHFEHIIQQPILQHVTPSHNN